MQNLGKKRQFPQILAVNYPTPRPLALHHQPELAPSPMPEFAPPIQGFPLQPKFSTHSMKDTDISYIANHLNNNLKMLLYLVDADKLKQVQNILFSKSSRQTRSTRKHHSNKFERMHRQAAPAPPFTPPFAPAPARPFAFPFADVIPGAIPPAFGVNYRKQKKQTQKQTQKHKYQPANSFPDKESSYLEEVMN